MSSFIHTLRVHYADTDAGGVVYHANYLKFFDQARTEFIRSLGYGQTELKQGFQVVFVVRSVQVRYLRPALLDDLLNITATIHTMKKASFILNQEVKRDNVILCSAIIEIACVQAETFRPTALPSFLFEQLNHES